jgi:hypothetical protein
MKNILTTAAVLFGMTAFAQVGINNISPKATLDITAKTGGTRPEGLIIPQLTGDQIRAATTATPTPVYGTDQKGLIIYATTADSAPAGATANITAPGYYYFDGSIWQRILGTSSGDSTNDAWTNDTTNSMVKIGTKADGTARAAGTDFIVKDNGYVGIGTTSPKAPLHLSYNNAASAITTSYLTPGLVLTGPSTGSGPGIYFEAQDNNTGTRIMKMHLSKDGLGDGYLNFESVTDNASGVVKKIMALSNNGNVNIDNTFYVDAASSKVGIGTSTPKSYLQVSSPAGQTTPIAAFSIVNCGSGCSQGTAKNIVLNNIHTNNSLFGSIDFVPGTDPLGDSGASIQGIDRDATNNYAGLSFFTRNATDYASRMVIKSSGNVGIGTSSPSAKLELNSGTADTSGLKFTNLNSASPSTSNASTLGVDNNGNVVIQSAAPIQTKFKSFTIDSNVATNSLISIGSLEFRYNTTTCTSSNSYIQMKSASGANNLGIIHGAYTDNQSSSGFVNVAPTTISTTFADFISYPLKCIDDGHAQFSFFSYTDRTYYRVNVHIADGDSMGFGALGYIYVEYQK